MKYKLRQKEVTAISWKDAETQQEAIKQLEELGCADIKIKTSGAGTSIDFKYPTPNSHRPEYYGSLFNSQIMVFDNDGKMPTTYSSRDFETLYEPSIETTFLERLVQEEEELGKKLSALNKAIFSDAFADKVGMYQFELLNLQHSGMVTYRRVLRMRIEDLKSKV